MLEYTLTESDLAAFAAWRDETSGELARRQRKQRVLGAWLVGVAGYLVVSAVLTIPLLLGRDLPLAALGEVGALAAGLGLGWWEWRRGLAASWLLARPYLRRARESLARTGADRRLSLDPSGLNVAVGGRCEHVAFRGIGDIVETDDHLFVLIGEKAAHVVPKRLGAPAAAFAADLRAGVAAA